MTRQVVESPHSNDFGGESTGTREQSFLITRLIKEPRMRWTGKTFGFVAALVSLSISPGVAFAASTVTGTVTFDGKAPALKPIPMDADPACAKKHSGPVPNEALVLGSGNTMGNIIVWVSKGLPAGKTYPAPTTPVVLDQNGCRYHPHVLGVMAGQSVQIKNDDPTTHNIHPTPKDNREWNESQPPSSPALEKNFAREEIMLPVKCNQHPWMKMYVNVVKSPFFAVTDKSGKYEIKGLPPGDYTLAFVHEKLGEQDQKVTVAPKETKTVDTSFKAAGE
jgi:plastocyanin